MGLLNVNRALNVGRNRVAIEGSFRPNGATGIVSGSTKGKGYSVARAGTGLYTITFDESAYDFDSCECSVREAAGTATIAQFGDYSAANKTLQLRILQQGSTTARTKTMPLDLLSSRLVSRTKSFDLLGSAVKGSTAPTVDATSGMLVFDADADTMHGSFRVPDDWDAASDMTVEAVWHSEAGDAVADTETVKWDINYYTVAEGEAVDNGTVVEATATYTASGGQTDKEQFRTDITIDYNAANQPLAKGDVIHWTINRDETTDTYSGGVALCELRLTYNTPHALIGTAEFGTTNPYFARVNSTTDPTYRLVWPASDNSVVQLNPFSWPADVNASADATVHFMGAMSGSTDTPVLAAAVFEGLGDTNFGGNSSAFGSSIAEETITLANANITGHPNPVNIHLTPGAHTTDDMYLYSAWLEYQSTESNGAYAAADLAADADAVVNFRVLFRNSSVDA